MAGSVVHKHAPEMKNPVRVFRMISNSIFSILFGVHYAIVGMWATFFIYVVSAVSGHVLFTLFWIEWMSFRRTCCYGPVDVSETDYALGGSCMDSTGRMYRSGAQGICDDMPVVQTVLLSVSLGAYGTCFCIWWFRHHVYMRHVYMILSAYDFADSAGAFVRIRRMCRQIELIPDTGLIFGRHEAYTIRGGLQRQRTLSCILTSLCATIFVVHAIENYTWACYLNFAWGTYGDMGMLAYGMCTYTGVEVFGNGWHRPSLDGVGLYDAIWPRTMLWGIVCTCAVLYHTFLVVSRYTGIRVGSTVFITDYATAYVKSIRVYIGLQMHLAKDDANPQLSVLAHGTGHYSADDTSSVFKPGTNERKA